MLHVDHLSVGYRSNIIVKNVNLCLKEGEITALIGPNGSGKSTLLKGVAGILQRQGQVNLEARAGEDAVPENNQFTYMPQDTHTSSSLTVLEVVLLGRLRSLRLRIPATLIEDARVALNSFNLLHLQSRCLAHLSGGQRQIVYLVQSVFRDTPVLLLDEPTGALDLYYQLAVLESVKSHTRRANVITLVAMHDLSLAMRYSDRIVCLQDGKIVADGAPGEVLTRSLIQSVYGVDADVIDTADGFQCVVATTTIRNQNFRYE
jgi:iron complex transport system ATP-binding protein